MSGDIGDVAWRTVPFDALTTRELHDVLRLRQNVFIVEQTCIFPEIDGRDPLALHLLGTRNGALVAYARIFLPGANGPGANGPDASVGRVVTDPGVRGSGLGHALMKEALRVLEREAPGATIRLAAQLHLERFYAAWGFSGVGERYVEDGILHLDMVRRPAG